MHGATIKIQANAVFSSPTQKNPPSLRPKLRFRASAMLLLRATGKCQVWCWMGFSCITNFVHNSSEIRSK